MSVTSIESVRLSLRSGFASAIIAATRKVAFFSVAAMLFGMLNHVAHCATINYPDPPTGNTVAYTGISESSLTDSLPLFGGPNIAGDSIDFNPRNFGAFGAFGSSDFTDGQLAFKVTAKPGFGIANINFAEAGTTSLFNSSGGGGTDSTRTDVSAVGVLNILAVDGNSINNAIPVAIHLLFSPHTSAPGDVVTSPDDPNYPLGGNYPAGTSGTFRLLADGGLGLDNLSWSGGELFDLNQVLVNHHVSFNRGVTQISVDLDNQLFAASEAGTISLIDKKDFGGLAVTVNMGSGGGPNGPEPTSLILAGLGFAGLTLGRRFFR